MPLSPTELVKLKGIRIKKCIIEESSFTATPINISIYQLPEIQIPSSTSLAEFYIRAQKFNRMRNFSAHYYMDKFGIWNTKELKNKKIIIALCGQVNQKDIIKFVSTLQEQFNIDNNKIVLKFENNNLKELLGAAEDESSISELFIEEKKEEVKPYIHVYTLDEGKEKMDNIPFKSMSIETNLPNFYYRVYAGNQWTKWIQGETQKFSSPIEGFQFDFQSDEYELKYRCNLKKRGWTQWRSSSISQPYHQPILNIRFAIKEKEG